ncbi:rod shape-determining protein MreD [Faecalicatena contorta]|uniref:rod shape-determining protein MreD n=1 Tax=Faecalicatena contorta TaxID=39482 RepID=UPI001F268003|nr:rod shape-determining protein MreD [Faecalicatena contorta]MCF2683336.1 rod shape-determining protein MreD [Faecalicatena contorta]
MKRKLITIIIITVCFLLECTVFHRLSFASVKPNLLIIITSSFGFMRGKKEGMAVGVCSGLLIDIFWGNLLGFHTLLFAVIGYINGSFRRLFFDDDIKLPIALIAASEMIYGLVCYFCMQMLQGDFAFGIYLIQIILPELVYTLLVTLILYQIILQINKKLEAEEQRSASRFV